MKRFARWFVICGGVGVLVAVALYVLGSIPIIRTNGLFNPYVMFVLAPGMILGLVDPTSIGDRLLIVGIVLGTNFVLYGLLGLLLCGAWSWFRQAPQALSGDENSKTRGQMERFLQQK